MDKELFAAMLKDLMEKLGDERGSHMHFANHLMTKYPEVNELQQLTKGLTSSFAVLRIVLKYLMFDIEATCREKDQLIAQLGDQE
jgi:hypothetical protein